MLFILLLVLQCVPFLKANSDLQIKVSDYLLSPSHLHEIHRIPYLSQDAISLIQLKLLSTIPASRGLIYGLFKNNPFPSRWTWLENDFTSRFAFGLMQECLDKGDTQLLNNLIQWQLSNPKFMISKESLADLVQATLTPSRTSTFTSHSETGSRFAQYAYSQLSTDKLVRQTIANYASYEGNVPLLQEILKLSEPIAAWESLYVLAAARNQLPILKVLEKSQVVTGSLGDHPIPMRSVLSAALINGHRDSLVFLLQRGLESPTAESQNTLSILAAFSSVIESQDDVTDLIRDRYKLLFPHRAVSVMSLVQAGKGLYLSQLLATIIGVVDPLRLEDVLSGLEYTPKDKHFILNGGRHWKGIDGLALFPRKEAIAFQALATLTESERVPMYKKLLEGAAYEGHPQVFKSLVKQARESGVELDVSEIALSAPDRELSLVNPVTSFLMTSSSAPLVSFNTLEKSLAKARGAQLVFWSLLLNQISLKSPPSIQQRIRVAYLQCMYAARQKDPEGYAIMSSKSNPLTSHVVPENIAQAIQTRYGQMAVPTRFAERILTFTQEVSRAWLSEAEVDRLKEIPLFSGLHI